VLAGESLWTIAEEYYGDGFAWTRIVEANNLANANDIEEGQVLVIPEATGEVIAEATDAPEASVAPSPEASPTVIAVATATPEAVVTTSPVVTDVKGDSYTVVAGDNLWEIAVKAYGDGYRWTDIAEANDLVNPGVIHAGNVLTLPR
jgi:nucleoid-associated protein YgaU